MTGKRGFPPIPAVYSDDQQAAVVGNSDLRFGDDMRTKYLQLQPEQAVMKTILSHANLIDCVEPEIRPDTAVLIEDGRIRAILPSGEVGSAGDALIIDLKGGYLMPGLWDVHIHPDYLSLDAVPLADQVTLFGHRLAAALTESGIVGLPAPAPITSWTSRGSGPSPPDSISALGCSPAVISSPPREDTF